MEENESHNAYTMGKLHIFLSVFFIYTLFYESSMYMVQL